MGICWYCYWGWAKPVVDVYEEAVRRLGGDSDPLHFGPSHIVWEDENFEDRNIDYCLSLIETEGQTFNLAQETLSVVRWSLEELRRIPERSRDPMPDDYDDEHPELFPPPGDVVMATCRR